jgi:hypothetical protein
MKLATWIEVGAAALLLAVYPGCGSSTGRGGDAGTGGAIEGSGGRAAGTGGVLGGSGGRAAGTGGAIGGSGGRAAGTGGAIGGSGGQAAGTGGAIGSGGRAAGTGGAAGGSGGGGAVPVGGPCGADGECATGQCITEAATPVYVGGYCTIRNCTNNCPAGSHCTGGGAIGSFGCFRECVIGQPCRDGYRCCPGSVPDAGTVGLCVPPTGTAISCAP